MNRFNILLSSAGRRHSLLQIFRQSLAQLDLSGEVQAADASRLSAAYQAADRAFLVPRCTSAEFIPSMLEICRRNEVKLLVPTIDTELPAYAAHIDAFAAIGTTIAISSPSVIAIGGDKAKTHAWLTREGFPTPRQVFAEEAASNPAAWPFPFFVKPAKGSASVGVAIVSNRNEFDAATGGGDFIVQTIAKGKEHTVDLLADRSGNCRCAVPRRRLETRGGEISKGVTVRSAPLQRLVVRLCKLLPGAYGCLNVQLFIDEPTGEMSVIEINPRFGGGFPLSWQAGAHYPRWIIEELLGRPSTASADNWREKLVMLRYDDAIFVDAETVGM